VKLFAVYLGGQLAPQRMGEDHEVVFVVSEDTRSARESARSKWTGLGRAHIDAVMGEESQGVLDPTYER
jgi:hypothetical protein